jgi:hypothetical protein
MRGKIQLIATKVVCHQFDYALGLDKVTMLDTKTREGFMCQVLNKSNRTIDVTLSTNEQHQKIHLTRYKNSISYFFKSIPRMHYEHDCDAQVNKIDKMD